MVTGIVLYKGPSMLAGHGPIVAIATFYSKNEKTGNMIQATILPDYKPGPLRAMRRRRINSAACGNCPLQGQYSRKRRKMTSRVCYVNVGQATRDIWDKYRRGGYPEYNGRAHNSLFRGRAVRWGAYGDPAALPLPLIRTINALADRWTGYSHQLLDGTVGRARADKLARIFMASTHDAKSTRQAIARKYRYFAAVSADEAPPTGAMACPYGRPGVTCEKCRLCNGGTGRNIFIKAHAAVGNNLPLIQLP